MSIIFKSENHEYIDLEQPGLEMISSTGIVGALKEKFNAKGQALKSSKNVKSKWFNMPVQEILDAWEAENLRAVTLGSWYHDMRERILGEHTHIDGLKIFMPEIVDGVKYSHTQKLVPGIYPELLIALRSFGVLGQGDRITVQNNLTVDIHDFKTSKEVTRKGFTNWEGKTKKLLAPISHLDECHFYEFALQLSLYMFMIIKNNPRLRPGKLTIDHVKFETEGLNKYGYPITAVDIYGNPMVKEIETIEVPYLKSEVATILKDLKMNREKYSKTKTIQHV